MSKFLMHIPKALQEGDEIIIAGNFVNSASEFCVDFVADVEEDDPANVIYQFKVHSDKICQNWKAAGEWMEDECAVTDTFILGDENMLITFKFVNNEVLVYSGDEGRNFECQFRLNEPVSNIAAVYICGDVERISEIRFRYA